MSEVEMSTIKLFIGTPVYGPFQGEFYECLNMTERTLAAKGIRTWWVCSKGCGVEWNRNALVAKFLEGEGTHLLFVDSDMTWSPKDIHRWLGLDRDIIVGAAIARRVDKVQWNVMPFEHSADPDESGMVEVLKAGTGLMLIRRNVIEAAWNGPNAKPYYPTIYDHTSDELRTVFRFDIGTPPVCSGWSDPTKQTLRGEDYNFCDDVRSMGFQVWCDTTARVGHFATIPISAGQDDLVRWLKTGPWRE